MEQVRVSIDILSLSTERYRRIDAPVRKLLLFNNMGVIENLKSNLGQFAGRRMFFACLRLPLVDATPARAMLLEI